MTLRPAWWKTADRPRYWWELPHAGVDLETTGVSVYHDRLVTSNITLFEPLEQGWRVSPTNWLADPGIPIHPKATETHGITNEYAREHGEPFGVVLAQVLSVLRSLHVEGWPIVGMNLAFDLSMLHYNALAIQQSSEPVIVDGKDVHSLVVPLSPDEIGPIYDIGVVDKKLQPYRRGKRKLEDLCRHYRVIHPGAHIAEGDVLASARVMQRQVRENEWLGKTDVDRLHRTQITWRAEQCESLQQHFRKRDPDAYVDPCWPVCRDPRHDKEKRP